MKAVQAWPGKWAKVNTLNMAKAKRVFIFFPHFSLTALNNAKGMPLI